MLTHDAVIPLKPLSTADDGTLANRHHPWLDVARLVKVGERLDVSVDHSSHHINGAVMFLVKFTGDSTVRAVVLAEALHHIYQLASVSTIPCYLWDA